MQKNFQLVKNHWNVLFLNVYVWSTGVLEVLNIRRNSMSELCKSLCSSWRQCPGRLVHFWWTFWLNPFAVVIVHDLVWDFGQHALCQGSWGCLQGRRKQHDFGTWPKESDSNSAWRTPVLLRAASLSFTHSFNIGPGSTLNRSCQIVRKMNL